MEETEVAESTILSLIPPREFFHKAYQFRISLVHLHYKSRKYDFFLYSYPSWYTEIVYILIYFGGVRSSSVRTNRMQSSWLKNFIVCLKYLHAFNKQILEFTRQIHPPLETTGQDRDVVFNGVSCLIMLPQMKVIFQVCLFHVYSVAHKLTDKFILQGASQKGVSLLFFVILDFLPPQRYEHKQVIKPPRLLSCAKGHVTVSTQRAL